MTRRMFLNALALAAASQGVFSSGNAWAAAEPEAPAVAPNQFGLDLYNQLAAPRDANLFFSPYSIHTALAMTSARPSIRAKRRSVVTSTTILARRS